MKMHCLKYLTVIFMLMFTGMSWADSIHERELPTDPTAYCTAPLDWYGSDELIPADIDRRLEEGSWFWDLSTYKVGLNVEEKSQNCDGACQQSIARSTARALNLWRHICITCAPGLMTAISIDNNIYMDLRFLTVMNRAHDDAIRQVQQAFLATVLQEDLPELKGRDLSISPYVELRPGHPVTQKICDIPQSTPQSLTKILRSGICQTEPDQTVIRFTNDFPCELENAIACGNPESEIEFWTREIGYYETTFDGEHRFVIGKPNALEDDQVDLVYLLAHEFGHVLGLGHIQTHNLPGDLPAVMSEKLQPSFCISIAETMMLSSAAARDYRYRATRGLALYRRGYEPKK